MGTDPDLPAGPTRPASIFIAAFLALQIAAPLQYYACREDSYDERFAWRMFSPTRMATCEPRFFQGPDRVPVQLARKFHQAWISTAKRGRLEVVRRMAVHLCEQVRDPEIRVQLSCRGVDGVTVERTSDLDVCISGNLWPPDDPGGDQQ